MCCYNLDDLNLFLYCLIFILLHIFKILFFVCFFVLQKIPQRKKQLDPWNRRKFSSASSLGSKTAEFQAPKPILRILHPAYSLVDKSKNLTRLDTHGKKNGPPKKTDASVFLHLNKSRIWKTYVDSSVLFERCLLDPACFTGLENIFVNLKSRL